MEHDNWFSHYQGKYRSLEVVRCVLCVVVSQKPHGLLEIERLSLEFILVPLDTICRLQSCGYEALPSLLQN